MIRRTKACYAGWAQHDTGARRGRNLAAPTAMRAHRPKGNGGGNVSNVRKGALLARLSLAATENTDR